MSHALNTSRPDPFLHLTFGALLRGGGSPSSLSRVSPTELMSQTAATALQLEVWTLATQTDTPEEFERKILAEAAAYRSKTTHARAAEAWASYWQRSYVRFGPASDVHAFELSRRWMVQRAVHGMLGRGAWPIKFNGNLFTVGDVSKPTAEADMWAKVHT